MRKACQSKQPSKAEVGDPVGFVQLAGDLEAAAGVMSAHMDEALRACLLQEGPLETRQATRLLAPVLASIRSCLLAVSCAL